jgi:hypothetical protein
MDKRRSELLKEWQELEPQYAPPPHASEGQVLLTVFHGIERHGWEWGKHLDSPDPYIGMPDAPLYGHASSFTDALLSCFMGALRKKSHA